MDPRIDTKLNDILHHCLARDPNRRYANADQMMYELEYYMYHGGYGPTNETLGKFIRELFSHQLPIDSEPKGLVGKTVFVDEAIRKKGIKPEIP
jgi:serine/threonine-protein kinase